MLKEGFELGKNIVDFIKKPFESFIDFHFFKKKVNFEAKQKLYNELFIILSKLDQIGKIKSTKKFILDEEKIKFFYDLVLDFEKNLTNWKENSGGYRLLEKKTTLQDYYSLENALGKGKSYKGMYGEDQLLKIWGRKNKLFESLKKEL